MKKIRRFFRKMFRIKNKFDECDHKDRKFFSFEYLPYTILTGHAKHYCYDCDSYFTASDIN